MEPTRRELRLKPDLRGLNVLRNHAAPSVNVIAVPGLAADPVGTWVDKDENWNWLENQLVELIPRARVWTFGYDSSWFGDFSVDTIIDEAANMLLDGITVNNLLPTSIIFVVHSFGGVVVMKSLMMAENPNNQWSIDGKALNLFRFIELILFFGTPFRGIHDWFQSALPVHARKLVPVVRDDMFHSFRKNSPVMNELSQAFVDRCHQYNKPNLGVFWEQHHSDVKNIVEDNMIQETHIPLVEEASAVLRRAHMGKAWIQTYQLARNHFNLHVFGPDDDAFDETVKFVLKKMKFSNRALCLDDLGRSFNPDEEECSKSFYFPEMDQREQDVVNAADDTCLWLLKTAEYLQWFNQQHGLLVITGHAGAGKSTMMKYISRHAKRDENIIVASFFFHARGFELQHSILGLFRSLLHQFMAQSSDLCEKITYIYWAKRGFEYDWEWNQTQIEETFLACLRQAAKAHRIRIYIDALDECGEEAASHLVGFFQSLADSLCVCFSSRNSPTIKEAQEISVEQSNVRDMRTFLRQQLGEFPFQDQILKRASGNFLWVKLVIDEVRSWLRRGMTSETIRHLIASLPIGIDQLCEHFFINVVRSEAKKSLKLFQWICFAARPLSLQELRFAMVLDEDTSHVSVQECQESALYIDTNEAMVKKVCELSHGLANISIYTTFSEGEEKVRYGNVRVIHQTVYDFLLERGLRILYESQDRGRDSTLIGWTHFRLSRSCIQYLSLSEVHDFCSQPDSYLRMERTHRIAHQKHPFLIYATEYWCQHAEIVEGEKIAQDDLLLYFVFNSRSPTSLFIAWTNNFDKLYKVWPMPDHTVSGRTLVHYACKHGLLSVLKAALGQGVEMNPTEDTRDMPLLWAVRAGQQAVVKWLLNRVESKAVFDKGAINEALCLAAEDGHEAIMKMLLQHHDDTKPASGSFLERRLLMRAAKHGHEPIVRLLLPRKDVAADSSSRSAILREALFDAAMAGHEAVIKLLLNQDNVTADFTTSNGYTPLAVAASSGHEAVVKLLLNRDEVSVNSTASHWNGDKCTPLNSASENGHVEVVKLLLGQEQVKTDKEDIEKSLTLAEFNGRRTSGEVVTILEEHLDGIDE